MSKPLLCLLRWALLAAVLWPCGVSAQVVLKPNGQAAMPLRVKSLTANVTLDGQFAATRQTLLFQNETAQRIEADFLYTLPPNTLVTSFAYWYGDEKVPAKVVEKEEAAAIYQHITTRQHDPALVEMVGKNTFRARIFPIMPNADLKVEMTLVQTLPSDAAGVNFTMPLVISGAERLDHLAVRLTIHPDPAVTGVLNNYGLPITQDVNGYHLTLIEANTHPAKDLHVHLTRSPRPFHAAMCVTPTDAQHGYFALAVTPDRLLKEVTVRIGKVHVSEVTALPEALLHSHHVITLVGRYVGQGLATVALNGEADGKRQEWVGQVQFGPRPLYAPLAEKLWAAAWMARLSDDPKNRRRVMQLSYHAGIPSKYTSWLAVPKAEMARYEQEIAQARAEQVAARLTELLLVHREQSNEARRLRRRLDALCRLTFVSPGDLMNNYASQRLSELGSYFSALALQQRERSVEARRAITEFDRLSDYMKLTSEDKQRYFGQLWQYLDSMAQSIEVSRHGGPVDLDQGWFDYPIITDHRVLDSRPLHQLAERFNHLTHAIGATPDDYLGRWEAVWKAYAIQQVRNRLSSQLENRQLDRTIIRRTEQEYLHLNTAYKGREYAQICLDLVEARAELHDNPTALAKRETELRARMGDPLLSVEAPSDSQQVVAVMPDGEVKPMEYNAATGRWEARFDIPTYAAEGDYVITIIVVQQNGMRRTLAMHYHVDLTAPKGAGHVETVGDGQRTLRLELEADEDVARVKAVLPWGEMVELGPSSQPHHYFALVPLPSNRSKTSSDVTFIVTDRAHNRTTLTVAMSAQ